MKRARHDPRVRSAPLAPRAAGLAGLFALVALVGLVACSTPAGPAPNGSRAAMGDAPPATSRNTAGATRRSPTAAPVRTSGLTGVSVNPTIRMPNGALLLTLEPAARDEALRGAPAAVGSLDHRAVGLDPATLLDRYFRDTSRGLHASVRITELDVDRRIDRDDLTVEGFRYRIDLTVHAANAPDEVLFLERGEGEAIWRQPIDGDAARWMPLREQALPQLARLAFQAALTSLQTRVRDQRGRLMELARLHRPADTDTPDESEAGSNATEDGVATPDSPTTATPADG